MKLPRGTGAIVRFGRPLLWPRLRAASRPLGRTRVCRRPTRARCGISTPPSRDPKLANTTAQKSTTVVRMLICDRSYLCNARFCGALLMRILFKFKKCECLN